MATLSGNERTIRRPRKETAHTRLTKALETLTQHNRRITPSATVTELCRLAEVSRNALYQYHPTILETFRRLQLSRTTTRSRSRASAEQRRLENIALREGMAKLTALVDHYYAAYRETTTLLDRRDRELAELRGKLHLKPVLLTSAGR